MSALITKTSNSSDYINDPDNLLQEGLNIIFKTFKIKKNEYLFQINEQKKLIVGLKNELEKTIHQLKSLQKEIDYYKSKNDQLIIENENLSKMVNNIKGRLTNKFDFKINNKEIATILDDNYKPPEKINLKNNVSNNFLKSNNIRSRNNECLKKKNDTDIKNINNYNKKENDFKSINNNDISLDEKFDFNRDLQTIRYEHKNRNYFNNDESNKNIITKNIMKKQSSTDRETISKDNNENKRRRKISNSNFLDESKNKLMNKNNEKFKSTPFLFPKTEYEEIKLDNKNGNYMNELKSEYNKIKNKEMAFFLNKCRIALDKKIFDKIINIFQEYKDGLITNDGLITKIRKYIKNYEDLLKLFDNVVS